MTAKLPIVVGEFGYQDPYGNVDEDTIMATAQARGIGYLGWSWSGNGSPVQYLDMSNGFNVNSLTWWGSRVFNGANGIRATSKEASIYGGGGGGGGGGGTTTTIVGTQSGRCVDVPGNTQANGTRVTLYDCAGNANQRYEYTAAQEFKVYGSKCLDAWLNGTTNGTAVAIYDCTGGANQKWTLHSDGTITNNLSGLCLDAVGQGTTNGTLIDLWACNGQTNQKWTRR